jgi:DNA mismatch repair ATPase MutS
MYLDSQALEHLEIFSNSKMESTKTLFSLIDFTASNFGKRIL